MRRSHFQRKSFLIPLFVLVLVLSIEFTLIYMQLESQKPYVESENGLGDGLESEVPRMGYLYGLEGIEYVLAHADDVLEGSNITKRSRYSCINMGIHGSHQDRKLAYSLLV